MHPITYTADLQKIRGKLVSFVQGMVFGLLLAGIGVLLYALVPEDPFGWVFLASASVLILVSVTGAVAQSRRLPVADNRLSVGNQGLVLIERGQTLRWVWNEVSAVRRHGNHAIISLAEGGRQSEMRINDIYQTPLEDIVARINAAREMAAAGQPAPESGETAMGPSVPERFHTAQAACRRRLFKELALFLGSMLIVPVMYLTLMKELPGEGVSDVFTATLIVGFAFFSILIAAVLFLTSGRSGNFLQITDEGLAWVQRWSMVRQWRWQDLSAFQVREGRNSRTSSTGSLAFVAADNGGPFRHMGLTFLLWIRSSSPGQKPFVIEEPFEVPAARIADVLNAYRTRALADTPPAQTIDYATADAAAGRPVGFQKNVQDIRSLGVVGWMLSFGGFVWIPIVLILGWPFDGFLDMQGPAQSVSHWLQRFLGMLVPIGLIAELLFLMREIGPADNALALDRNGLTLTRGGNRKLWSWSDLSAFQVEARKVLGLFGPRHVIVFGAPGGRDLRSRFLRLCYALTGHAPAMVIEDVYDTPLDDIAAALNRYRAEGAGGGPGAVPAE